MEGGLVSEYQILEQFIWKPLQPPLLLSNQERNNLLVSSYYNHAYLQTGHGTNTLEWGVENALQKNVVVPIRFNCMNYPVLQNGLA
jgi:hypothetical protein